MVEMTTTQPKPTNKELHLMNKVTRRAKSFSANQTRFAANLSRAHTAIFNSGLKPAQVLRMSRSEATEMVDGLGPMGYLALRKAYRNG